MTEDVGMFDYVVIGAGSSGAVVAARLSENPRTRVLLLEAGPSGHRWTSVPAGLTRLLDNPEVDWRYRSESEQTMGGRKIPVARGRIVGGSSAINGMVYTRGQREDYNSWAEFGISGWSYDDVLPLYRQLETFMGPPSEYRGSDGPVKITVTPRGTLFYESIFSAAEENGIAANPDYNGATQEGISMTQATIYRGRRMSTAVCYLRPARRRRNLLVLSEARAERLIFHGRTCTGVQFRHRGRNCRAKAGREVVLSAGAIGSPQLLEISGIGEPGRLGKLGITPVTALPGVGENLQDHIAPRLTWRIDRRGVSLNERGRGMKLIAEVLRYGIWRDGLLSLPVAPLRAYVRVGPGAQRANAGIFFYPYSVGRNFGFADRPGMMASTNVLRPQSRGSVHIISADPMEYPAIKFNFLSAEDDLTMLLAAVKKTREIVASPRLDGFRGEELSPGAAGGSDDELIDWIRSKAQTTYHPVGTCRMGIDTLAVLDERLRVHGLHRLRVADASAIPLLTSGNTNAPAIMIGEKAAQMIQEDAA